MFFDPIACFDSTECWESAESPIVSPKELFKWALQIRSPNEVLKRELVEVYESLLKVHWESVGSPLGVCWESAGSPLGVCWESARSLLGVCWESTGSLLGVSWKSAGNRLGVGWELNGSHFGVGWKPTRLCSPLALHELSIFPWYFQLVSWSCLCPFDTLVFSCHLFLSNIVTF